MIRTESRIISAYMIRDSVKREFQIRFVIRDSGWRDFRIWFMIRITLRFGVMRDLVFWESNDSIRDSAESRIIWFGVIRYHMIRCDSVSLQKFNLTRICLSRQVTEISILYYSTIIAPPFFFQKNVALK